MPETNEEAAERRRKYYTAPSRQKAADAAGATEEGQDETEGELTPEHSWTREGSAYDPEEPREGSEG
jgi:hypothetical protein